MKKALLIAILAALPLFAAQSARAISLPAGPVWGHFSDWTDLYDQAGNPLGLGVLPSPGDEGRAIVFLNQFYNANTGVVHWTPSASEELTATEYDFVLGGIGGPGGGIAHAWKWVPDTDFNPGNGFTPGYIDWTARFAGNPGTSGGVIDLGNGQFELYFVPGSGGGRIDIWRDTQPDWDQGTPTPGDDLWTQGPAAWVGSDYPGVSDLDADGVSVDPGASLWLTGTYAPLFNDLGANSVKDPGDPLDVFFDMNGNAAFDAGTDIWAVYATLSWTTGGVGVSHGWVDFDGGSFFPLIEQDGLGPGYDLYLNANLHPSNYGTSAPWATRSSDPTFMYVIPEPGSMALLGAGLWALVGSALLRRKKK